MLWALRQLSELKWTTVESIKFNAVTMGYLTGNKKVQFSVHAQNEKHVQIPGVCTKPCVHIVHSVRITTLITRLKITMKYCTTDFRPSFCCFKIPMCQHRGLITLRFRATRRWELTFIELVLSSVSDRQEVTDNRTQNTGKTRHSTRGNEGKEDDAVGGKGKQVSRWM